MGKRRDPQERFESFVDRSGGPDACHVYRGAVRFEITKTNATEIRRFAWELANGPIPPKRAVMATCGTNKCVNPRHLKLRAWYDPVARFWEKIQKTGGCWVWTGTKLKSGYGQHRLSVKVAVSAHRYSYELHYGPIEGHVPGDPEKEICVCHRCDNPSCVRPDHLFLGSDKDNIRDMLAKGRAAWQRPKGVAQLSFRSC